MSRRLQVSLGVVAIVRRRGVDSCRAGAVVVAARHAHRGHGRWGGLDAAEDAVGRSGSPGHLQLRDEHAAAAPQPGWRQGGPVGRGSRSPPGRHCPEAGSRSSRRRRAGGRLPLVQRRLDGPGAHAAHGGQAHVAHRRSAGRQTPAARAAPADAGRATGTGGGRTCRRAASTPGSRRATSTWMSATAASSGAATRAADTRTCPAIYNNMAQILQAPGYVVIYAEMIHFARIIPVDGRPPLPDTVETWLGDPRGRWEGDTLVVETRNFVGSNAHMVGRTGVVYGNANPKTFTIVERFTRTGPETIEYQVTIVRSGDLDAAVHDLGAVEQDDRADLRVPVPGNELRHVPLARRRPRARETRRALRPERA